ncbi:hypothetical protein LWC05_06765 [Acetobacter sicerae]|uniref:Transposase n=1 Tax=Acetobacter sicerae TaxID=85325 RepID=A0ABS8VRT4_9PROT|nr:hypothetical protein [Acetobacter sicerae]MCE0743597.1 hypothetical protein [Acetobacter sicerae]
MKGCPASIRSLSVTRLAVSRSLVTGWLSAAEADRERNSPASARKLVDRVRRVRRVALLWL